MVWLPQKYVTEMEGMVTRGSVLEYAEVMRQRYRRASGKSGRTSGRTGGRTEGKGMALTEFVRVTGYNRKSAIRLLRQNKSGEMTLRGRPKRDSQESA